MIHLFEIESGPLAAHPGDASYKSKRRARFGAHLSFHFAVPAAIVTPHIRLHD